MYKSLAKYYIGEFTPSKKMLSVYFHNYIIHSWSYSPHRMVLGSSTASLILRRNVTASLPSISR